MKPPLHAYLKLNCYKKIKRVNYNKQIMGLKQQSKIIKSARKLLKCSMSFMIFLKSISSSLSSVGSVEGPPLSASFFFMYILSCVGSTFFFSYILSCVVSTFFLYILSCVGSKPTTKKPSKREFELIESQNSACREREREVRMVTCAKNWVWRCPGRGWAVRTENKKDLRAIKQENLCLVKRPTSD